MTESVAGGHVSSGAAPDLTKCANVIPWSVASRSVPAHVGRRWNGPDRLSYECDCPKTPCGLTILGTWRPGCDFHGPTKSVRQGHSAEDCPGAEEVAADEPEDPWWM